MARWELSKLRLGKESAKSKDELADQLENFVMKEQQAKQHLRQLRTVTQDSESSCESDG